MNRVTREVIKLLNLAVLVVFAWAFGRYGSWEAGTGLGIFLLTLLYQEIGKPGAETSRDQKLFTKFLQALPSNSRTLDVILRRADFGIPFMDEYLTPLERFGDEWDNAEHEFDDKLLNHTLGELKRAISAFQAATVPHFSYVGQGSPLLTMDFRDNEDRPHKLEARRKLNAMGRQIYELHQQLVREGQSRFK